MGFNFNIKKRLKDIYEFITPQNETVARNTAASNRSIAATNQQITQHAQSGRPVYGVLARPQARQQFIAQNRPAPPPTVASLVGSSLRDTLTKPQAWRDAPKVNVGSFKGSGLVENMINSPFRIGEGGVQIGQKEYKKGVGNIVAGAVDSPLGFIPVGKVAQAASKAPRIIPKVVAGAKQGAKEGAVYGAAYGGADAASHDGRPGDIAKGTAVGAGIGLAAGGALGAGLPLAGAGVRQTVKAVNNRAPLAPAQAGSIRIKKPEMPPEIASVVAKADADAGRPPVNPAEMGAQARRQAKDFASSKISKLDKAKDFVSENITDDTAYFQGLDREIARRNGTKVRKTSAAQRLDPQIQAFRNSTAMKEQRYQDTGIADFAKQLGGKQDYNNYTIYRTFRTNDERARLNKKPDEDVRTSYARWTGGRDYNKDAQAFNQLQSDPKYNALFTEENAITQKILRDRGADPNLSLSPREAEEIIAKYPNFTPQQRVLEDDLLQFQTKGNVGSMQGKNVKELKQGSFSRPLEDPLTALMGYSDELVAKAQGNKVMSTIVENFPEKVRPLVTAEQLQAKEAARINLGELGLAGRTVEKELRANRKATSDIGREIDALIRAEGGKTTLRPTPQQITVKLAEMTNGQAERIATALAKKNEAAARLVRETQVLRDQADDIKAAKVGIMSSGDLAKFESASNKNTRRRVVQDSSGVGREEIYEIIDPRLAQNLDQLKGHQLSKAAEVLGVPTRVFKFFTTGPGSPAFVPIALTRDLFASILTAKAPLRAALDPRSYVDAFKASVKRGELFEEGQRRGISGTMTVSERNAEAISANALRNPGLKRAKTWKSGRQAFRDVEDLGNYAERFTRMRLASGVYRQSLARYSKDPTLTPEQVKDRALWDMAEEFREGAINFGRGGKVVRELNTGGVAYLNPAVQGANRIRRVARESPGRFIAGMATATALIAGTIAYNRSSAERKEIWDNLSEEEKKNNVILMGPNAKFDRETGAITGIIKLAAPYEYRALLAGMNQVFDDANPADYGDMALAGLATITGLDTKNPSSFVGQLIPQPAKPFIEDIANHSFFAGKELTPDYLANRSGGDKSQETKNNTSGVAKVINKLSGNAISPIVADNYISGAFGGSSKDIAAGADQLLKSLGVIDEKDATSSTPWGRLQKRFTESFGDSDASKYFGSMENAGKGLKGQDQLLLKALVTARYDKDGKKMEKTPATQQLYYEAMFNDGVRSAYVKGQKDAAKAQGKEYDPLYDLPDDQLKQYFRIKATPRDSDDQKVLEDRNPWLKDLQTKRSAFFDKIDKKSAFAEDDKEADIVPSDVKYPEINEGSQAKLDVLNTLDDEKRAEYIRDNPDVQAALDSFSQYTNDVRRSLLQPELKPYPKASPEVQGWMDEYNSLPKGDGSRGGNATRSAWIKANPNKYAAMQTAFMNSAVWTLANNAGKARFVGEEMNEKALGAAHSLGNYSIAKTKNSDGTSSYELNPQQVASEKQASFSGGSSSGGRKVYATKGRSSRFGGGARRASRKAGGGKTIRIKKSSIRKGASVRVKKMAKPKTVKIRKSGRIKRVRKT